MPQSRHVKVVSSKQLRANRRNAQLSTGPQTAEGKARAAMNALVHGIFSKALLLPGEDPQQFAAFRELLLEGLDPRDFLEQSIAEQYVEARWRIRRIRDAERDAHALEASNIETFDGGPFIDLRLRLAELPRLESLDPRDDPRPRNNPAVRGRMRDQRHADRRALVPVSATMAQSFANPTGGAFERLSRYEHRLEMSADRALRQLRQLRKERGPNWTPPDDESGETKAVDAPRGASDAQNEQDEPISAAPATSHGQAGTCAQRSCPIEPVAPAKLPSPQRGLGVPPEHCDQTAPPQRPGETRETPKPRKQRQERETS